MKYGFIFPGGEARVAAELARDAERAGWDAFFVPDSVWGHDPWVTLAACAMTTKRLRLGTMLTPISRRRPWKLASETATLDRLSNGRVILAVGLGALDTGFANFGEETDRVTRAELLDEGLEIIARAWRGRPFKFKGKHYRVTEFKLKPLIPPPPLQTPGIPVWVVGAWFREKSMRRVLKWDGWLPNKLDDQGKPARLTPDDVRAAKAYIDARRQAKTPFDIVVEGRTLGSPRAKARAGVRAWADAGATWWLEALWSAGKPNLKKVQDRIRQGPPRVE